MQQTVNLKAGQLARVQMAGVYAALVITGAAAVVAVALRAGNGTIDELRTVGRSITVRSELPFDAVELRANVDTVVELVVTNGRVTVDTLDGSTVNVTASTPLLVSNDRGSPGNLLHVTGVSVTDAPATGLSNGAAVACGPAAVVVKAANVNARAARFCNLGPDPVALGGAGITWAARCIVLYAGDVWLEDRAANLAWSAITDAGKTASVTVQEVTA